MMLGTSIGRSILQIKAKVIRNCNWGIAARGVVPFVSVSGSTVVQIRSSSYCTFEAAPTRAAKYAKQSSTLCAGMMVTKTMSWTMNVIYLWKWSGQLAGSLILCDTLDHPLLSDRDVERDHFTGIRIVVSWICD